MNTISFNRDGVQIGELEWDLRPGATYEVHLDVHPSHHRKGVGRSMMNEIEAYAKAQGGLSLYSFCASDNTKALAFFKGMGFTATYANDFYGFGRHAYFLHKAIGAPK
jgi:GNAT superfamily N-acetyltransferase